MNETEIPPILERTPTPPPKAKWRWAVHLFLLVGYVLGLGLIVGQLREPSLSESALPGDVRGLLIFCAVEFLFFAIIFAVAWLFSRAKASELYFKWPGGIKPVLWGALHSVLLRVALAIAITIVILPFAALKGEKVIEKKVNEFRPKIEAVIEPAALDNPVYLALTVSLVSFVVAGFREELWRAGILAGFAALFPAAFGSRKGQYYAVLIAAVIFGIGHAPQGIGGVVLTGALGVGLGAIMVWHQSIWVAVLAHGFFDATTFALLYIVTKFMPDALKSLGIS
jgi:membrane protease YdiL (CAAX protease family)